jgi:hydrogenase maturation factor
MTFCITCSDAAEPMHVEAIAGNGATATCVDGAGHRSEVMLDLVPGTGVGADVLVHAGVALLVVEPAR